MNEKRRAYRAIARAYRLHQLAPKWALELLKRKWLKEREK